MRRLVAAFSSKRSDKSDTASNASVADKQSKPTVPPKPVSATRPGFFKSKSLSRGSSQPDSKQRRPEMLPVSTVRDHAPSSSSSSSGGPSTPHDEVESVGPPHAATKSWMPIQFLHDKVLPPAPAHDPSRPYIPRLFNDSPVDDDASSSQSEEAGLLQLQLPPSAQGATVSQPLTPSAYCIAIANNRLQPPFSPPPLLVVPNAPLFPRSCNRPQELSGPSDSIRRRLHHMRLLRRLNTTPADRYLAPYAGRTAPSTKHLSLVLDDHAVSKTLRVSRASLGLRRWIERPCFEDRVLVYVPAENGVVRPERVSATAAVEALGYSDALDALAGMPDEDVAVVSQDLFTEPPAPNTPTLSLTPSTASISSLPPSPVPSIPTDSAPPPASSAQSTKAFPTLAYKSSPSPLRMASPEIALPGPPAAKAPPPRSFSSPTITKSPARPAAMSSSNTSPSITTTPQIQTPDTPRHGVRFAEDDDKDDSIPLDYVLRIKQAKDQKAKFLAAERARRESTQIRDPPARPSLETPQQMREDLKRVAAERRKLEEEKRRHELERRQQEEERKKWEQERAAWERQKRAEEEERRKRMYAEEIVEARRRREGTRQGPIPKVENITSWNGDREKERERKGSEAKPRYSRAKYDDLPGMPRRESSEPGFVNASSTSLRLPHPGNSSPGSSGPPSVGTGSVRDSSSRPPSMYSTPPSSASAIDLRQRRESKASRRASMMSDGSALAAQQQMFMQQGMGSPYPWGMGMPPVPPMPMNMNMNMVPVAVPMPMMQMQMPMMPYADMPLLPPTPPFMMQSYGPRQGQGQRSHSASPTRSPHSSSSDRGQDASAKGSHRKMPSDELPKRSSDVGRSASPYGQPGSPAPSYSRHHSSSPSSYSPQQPQPQPRSASRSSQRQSQAPSVRPTPVSTWTQPAFQNLSRPPADRRQTMIR
ncbi:hypothetical protein BDW22DRAFT_1342114 [Trametopsis cervina]|nr:hypothetical protein BDW22DRAFT_1342114 [Trametopsis cervina]